MTTRHLLPALLLPLLAACYVPAAEGADDPVTESTTEAAGAVSVCRLDDGTEFEGCDGVNHITFLYWTWQDSRGFRTCDRTGQPAWDHCPAGATCTAYVVPQGGYTPPVALSGHCL